MDEKQETARFDPAPQAEPPSDTPPPPEDLLAAIRDAPRATPLGNQAKSGEAISRSEMEDEIRSTVQECFEFSRAYMIHFSHIDSRNQLQHKSYNFYMPMDNLAEIVEVFREFTAEIQPEMPKQVLPGVVAQASLSHEADDAKEAQAGEAQ